MRVTCLMPLIVRTIFVATSLVGEASALFTGFMMPLIVGTVFVATSLVSEASALFTGFILTHSHMGGRNSGRFRSSSSILILICRLTMLIKWAVFVVASFVSDTTTFLTASAIYTHIYIIEKDRKSWWVCIPCSNVLFDALLQFGRIKILIIILLIFSIGMNNALPLYACLNSCKQQSNITMYQLELTPM